MALINNTKSPNRVTGILNLTPGVWRMDANAHKLNDYLMWVPYTFQSAYKTMEEGVERDGNGYAGAMIITKDGGITRPQDSDIVNWSQVVFERVADTIDLVLRNNAQ